MPAVASVELDWGKQVGADGAPGRPTFLPHQDIHLALIRPVFHPLHQLCPHRICQHILPLLGVVLRTSQLSVPKIPLPERGILPVRPVACGMRLPEGNPLFERPWREFRRCAKEMRMVGHEHISPDRPGCRSAPCVSKSRVSGSVRKHRLPASRANGQKNDGGGIESLVQWRMRGVVASGFVHHKGWAAEGNLQNQKSRR